MIDPKAIDSQGFWPQDYSVINERIISKGYWIQGSAPFVVISTPGTVISGMMFFPCGLVYPLVFPPDPPPPSLICGEEEVIYVSSPVTSSPTSAPTPTGYFMYITGQSLYGSAPVDQYGGWRIEKRAMDLTVQWIVSSSPSFGAEEQSEARSIKGFGNSVYVGGYVPPKGAGDSALGVYNAVNGSAQAYINLSAPSTFMQSICVDNTNVYCLLESVSKLSSRIESRNATSLSTVNWTVFVSTLFNSAYSYSAMNDDANYLYVAYTDFDVNGITFIQGGYRVAKLRKSDGSIVWDTTYNHSNYICRPKGIVVDDTGVYSAGNLAQFNFNDIPTVWYAEKRDINTGAIQWQVRNDDPLNSDNKELVYALSIDSSSMYITGNFGLNRVDANGRTGQKPLLEKRDKVNGSLIISNNQDFPFYNTKGFTNSSTPMLVGFSYDHLFTSGNLIMPTVHNITKDLVYQSSLEEPDQIPPLLQIIQAAEAPYNWTLHNV